MTRPCCAASGSSPPGPDVRWPSPEPGEPDQGQYDRRTDVLGVPLAGALIERELVTALGGWESGFRVPGADLDFSWRSHARGRRVVVAPWARVRSRGDAGRAVPTSAAERRAMRRVALTRCAWWTAPFLALWVGLGELVAALVLALLKRPGAALRELGDLGAVEPFRPLLARWRTRGRRTVRRRDLSSLFVPGAAIGRQVLDGLHDAVVVPGRESERTDVEVAPRSTLGHALRQPGVLAVLLVLAGRRRRRPDPRRGPAPGHRRRVHGRRGRRRPDRRPVRCGTAISMRGTAAGLGGTAPASPSLAALAVPAWVLEHLPLASVSSPGGAVTALVLVLAAPVAAVSAYLALRVVTTRRGCVAPAPWRGRRPGRRPRRWPRAGSVRRSRSSFSRPWPPGSSGCPVRDGSATAAFATALVATRARCVRSRAAHPRHGRRPRRPHRGGPGPGPARPGHPAGPARAVGARRGPGPAAASHRAGAVPVGRDTTRRLAARAAPHRWCRVAALVGRGPARSPSAWSASSGPAATSAAWALAAVGSALASRPRSPRRGSASTRFRSACHGPARDHAVARDLPPAARPRPRRRGRLRRRRGSAAPVHRRLGGARPLAGRRRARSRRRRRASPSQGGRRSALPCTRGPTRVSRPGSTRPPATRPAGPSSSRSGTDGAAYRIVGRETDGPVAHPSHPRRRRGTGRPGGLRHPRRQPRGVGHRPRRPGDRARRAARRRPGGARPAARLHRGAHPARIAVTAGRTGGSGRRAPGTTGPATPPRLRLDDPDRSAMVPTPVRTPRRRLRSTRDQGRDPRRRRAARLGRARHRLGRRSRPRGRGRRGVPDVCRAGGLGHARRRRRLGSDVVAGGAGRRSSSPSSSSPFPSAAGRAGDADEPADPWNPPDRRRRRLCRRARLRHDRRLGERRPRPGRRPPPPGRGRATRRPAPSSSRVPAPS